MSPSGAAWPPPRRRRKSRAGLVLVIVAGLVAVFCGGPGAFVYIHYVKMATGPYHQLPDLCASVESNRITTVVGPVIAQKMPGDPAKAAGHSAECRWHAPESVLNVRFAAVAALFDRTFWGGSTGNAKYQFELDAKIAQSSARQLGSSEVFSYLDNVGTRAYCVAHADFGFAKYDCELLAGNVMLKVTASPPPAKDGNLLTPEQVANALDGFVPATQSILRDFVGHL